MNEHAIVLPFYIIVVFEEVMVRPTRSEPKSKIRLSRLCLLESFNESKLDLYNKGLYGG